jgi:hypothetical protein
MTKRKAPRQLAVRQKYNQIVEDLRKNYYKEYDISNPSLSDKKILKNEMLYNLFKQPVKDKGDEVAHTTNYEPYHTYQADLLQMPKDGDYHMILTVVDVHTGKTDAEPLTSKTSQEVKEAFETIFNKKKPILKKPVKIRTDSGNEFKGEVKKYFQDLGVVQTWAIPGRHRQVAIVEKRNGTIARALFQRMTAEELITDTKNTEWVDYLPDIIKAINKHVKPRFTGPRTDEIRTGPDNKILPIGTRVRVQVDNPKEAFNDQKLGFNFRKTDIRFDTKIKTITSYILKPDTPVLYILDNNNNVAYTKKQLQVVSENEKEPMVEVVIKKKNMKDKKFIPKKDY